LLDGDLDAGLMAFTAFQLLQESGNQFIQKRFVSFDPSPEFLSRLELSLGLMS